MPTCEAFTGARSCARIQTAANRSAATLRSSPMSARLRRSYWGEGFGRDSLSGRRPTGSSSSKRRAVRRSQRAGRADHTGDGRSLALLDFDRDGRQDLVIASANSPKLSLFRNEIGLDASHKPTVAVRLIGGNRGERSLRASGLIGTVSARRSSPKSMANQTSATYRPVRDSRHRTAILCSSRSVGMARSPGLRCAGRLGNRAPYPRSRLAVWRRSMRIQKRLLNLLRVQRSDWCSPTIKSRNRPCQRPQASDNLN